MAALFASLTKLSASLCDTFSISGAMRRRKAYRYGSGRAVINAMLKHGEVLRVEKRRDGVRWRLSLSGTVVSARIMEQLLRNRQIAEHHDGLFGIPQTYTIGPLARGPAVPHGKSAAKGKMNMSRMTEYVKTSLKVSECRTAP